MVAETVSRNGRWVARTLPAHGFQVSRRLTSRGLFAGVTVGNDFGRVMSYCLGIDIGTSVTAASLCRVSDGVVAPQESVSLGAGSTTAPSAVFLGEDGLVLVGDAAHRRAATAPDRVLRGCTRRVGDPVAMMVGDDDITGEEVYAVIARWAVDTVTEREGCAPDSVVLTHPPEWKGHRTALVREALAAVGLPEAVLITEPEAAAVHHDIQDPAPVGEAVAVYDLGGTGFGAALLRKKAEGAFELVGESVGIERLGGADIDQLVFERAVESLGQNLGDLDPDDPGTAAAVARLRQDCREAKEALSFDSETTISAPLPGAQQVRLMRSELEAMVAPLVGQTVHALRQVMAEAGSQGVRCIDLVGGSSRIPLVAQLLSQEFGLPVHIAANPMTTAAAGAARWGAAERAPVPVAEEEVPSIVSVPADAGALRDGTAPGPSPRWGASAAVATRPRSRRGVVVAAVGVGVAAITAISAVWGTPLGPPENAATAGSETVSGGLGAGADLGNGVVAEGGTAGAASDPAAPGVDAPEAGTPPGTAASATAAGTVLGMGLGSTGVGSSPTGAEPGGPTTATSSRSDEQTASDSGTADSQTSGPEADGPQSSSPSGSAPTTPDPQPGPTGPQPTQPTSPGADPGPSPSPSPSPAPPPVSEPDPPVVPADPTPSVVEPDPPVDEPPVEEPPPADSGVEPSPADPAPSVPPATGEPDPSGAVTD